MNFGPFMNLKPKEKLVRCCVKNRNNFIPTIGSACNELFISGMGSDVNILIQNIDRQVLARISAHKCILMARSPVFKAMFTHSMSESNTNDIVISDFSPEVIREMLHFMYTDKLQSETLDNTMFQGLLGAAIKYNVPGLIDRCETLFCNQVVPANVLQMYKIAERTGSSGLKEAVITYIKRNSSELVNLVEFQPLLEKCLAFAAGISVEGPLPDESAIAGEKIKTDGGYGTQTVNSKGDDGCIIM